MERHRTCLHPRRRHARPPPSIHGALRATTLSAGLPRIRLHDLRHSYATAALAAGVQPKVVSERLGHANVSITLDTYPHVLPSIQEDAARKVAALILRG